MPNPEKGADRAAQTRQEKELQGIRAIHDRISSLNFIEDIEKSIREKQEAGEYTEQEAEEKLGEAQWFADFAAGSLGAAYAHTNLTDAVFGALLTIRRQGKIPSEQMIPAMMIGFGVALFEFITDLIPGDQREREAAKFWAAYADTVFDQIWSAFSDHAHGNVSNLMKSQKMRTGRGGAMAHMMAQAWVWSTSTYPDAPAAAKRMDRLVPHFRDMLLDDSQATYSAAKQAVDKAVGEN